jgi:hypothetical protein
MCARDSLQLMAADDRVAAVGGVKPIVDGATAIWQRSPRALRREARSTTRSRS